MKEQRPTKAQLDVIRRLARDEAIRIGPDSDLSIISTGLVEAYIETEHGLFTGLRLTPSGEALAKARFARED